MYQGSQNGTPAGKLSPWCCFVWHNVLHVCLFHWIVFSKATRSSLRTQILPLSPVLHLSSCLILPRGLKTIEFTYYLSFQLLLKLLETSLNSRKHTFLHLHSQHEGGKMEHRVIRNEWCSEPWQSRTQLSYWTKAFRKHYATCWAAAMALTLSLPDTKRAQGSPHLPLLPLAPVKATPYCRAPLALGDRRDNIPCVSRGTLVTVSSPCPSLLGLNQQLGPQDPGVESGG